MLMEMLVDSFIPNDTDMQQDSDRLQVSRKERKDCCCESLCKAEMEVLGRSAFLSNLHWCLPWPPVQLSFLFSRAFLRLLLP